MPTNFVGFTSLFWLPEALVLELKSLEICKLLDPTVKDEFDVGNFILCISLCEKNPFFLDFFAEFLFLSNPQNNKQSYMAIIKKYPQKPS